MYAATIDKIRDTSHEEAWKLARKGKFSASRISELLGKGKDSMFGVGAMSYINEVACDAFTEFEDTEGMETYAMKMGKILEPQAAAHHQKIVGVEITHYGGNNPYFREYCPDSGGSPDAIAYDISGDISFGAEYKCPKRETHWDYLFSISNQQDLQKVCPKYYAQVQFLIHIFKCDLWHWCSYNDYFKGKHKILIVEVQPDKLFMDNLLIRLKSAIKKKYELIEELRSKG